MATPDPVWWQSPLLLSGVLPIAGGIVALVLKEYFDRRRSGQLQRMTDNELRGTHDSKFRDVLIAELSTTRSALHSAEARERDCLRREIALDTKVNRMGWVVEWLCREIKVINPNFDDAQCRVYLPQNNSEEPKK